MTFPLEIPDVLRRQLPPGTGVLLGISGGVDSAVTLALLKALECEVQCVTFKNFCYSEDQVELPEQSCCSLEAIDDARRLAFKFDAPHWVGNVEKPFQAQVIDPFVSDFLRAETPNPCLACNSTVRFPELVRLAERHGCDFAATGHYARIGGQGNEARLMRGVDPGKDQSYFLHRVSRQLFPRMVFPLGWYVKPQVREAARELGLEMADKRDSQEICFVPEDDRGFLFADQPDAPATQPGNIVDRQGRVLGRHRGLVHYTVGQRKGLGVAASEPIYVYKLDLERQELVVGSKADLRQGHLLAAEFQAAVPDFPEQWADTGEEEPVVVRIRHRHPGARVQAWQLTGQSIRLTMDDFIDGPTPGQACVLYRGDVVLGGGRILKDQERDHE